MAKTIRQQATIRATPHAVYEALMDSRKHARFTGESASISRKVGGAIRAGGGYISGVNLDLVPDRKIVQSWHAADWPEGHMSTAVFVLKRIPGGTRLFFTHRNVPDEHAGDIAQGWKDYYWTPMKRLLEGK
jgi:uncharacterized protein YndB with AHSA1/START domain